MINIKSFTFNPFSENTYLLYSDTKEAIIIDPGCYESAEKEELKLYIEQNSLKPVRLLNTHCHVDHVFGNNFISTEYNLDLEIHELDLPVLEVADQTANMYGFRTDPQPKPNLSLKDGDTINLGDSQLEIVFCPGHAPGHVVFVNHEQKDIIGGDVLFLESVGRTDLPGGDHDTLINYIKEKLFVLDDDYTVHPGHGPTTTIGHEKLYNPFVRIN